jgi:hypothetical protein
MWTARRCRGHGGFTALPPGGQDVLRVGGETGQVNRPRGPCDMPGMVDVGSCSQFIDAPMVLLVMTLCGCSAGCCHCCTVGVVCAQRAATSGACPRTHRKTSKGKVAGGAVGGVGMHVCVHVPKAWLERKELRCTWPF